MPPAHMQQKRLLLLLKRGRWYAAIILIAFGSGCCISGSAEGARCELERSSILCGDDDAADSAFKAA